MEYHRILLVEDELQLRQVVARNLRARGHVVTEATTATDAVAAILAERPDLVLLDLNLPDRSGWDVLRELRARAIEVPTVVVSAVRVTAGRLAEFHPLAYLPKPFPLDALLRLVAAEPTAAPSGEDRSPGGKETGPPSDEPAPVAKEGGSYA